MRLLKGLKVNKRKLVFAKSFLVILKKPCLLVVKIGDVFREEKKVGSL